MSSRHLIYIGNQLVARGGAPTAMDLLAPLLEKEGYKLTTASGRKNNLLRLVEMIGVVVNNARQADLVLIDTYSTHNFWYAYLIGKICRSLKIPYIPILHGGNLPDRLEKSPSATFSFFSNAQVNVSPSLFLKQEFEEQGISGVVHIPNSIPLAAYPFKDRKVIHPKLLWVRSFSTFYNPLLAIKVLEEVLLKFPTAELCMVGPAKDASFESCREYATAKELPVTFTGRLDKEAWVALSAEYDIFLNTTSIDNTPISVIEAMALGLPVVSTNVGGIPFIIEDQKQGLLVAPAKVREMAEAVTFLVHEPKKAQQLARSARKKISSFDWEVVKHQWNELLSA